MQKLIISLGIFLMTGCAQYQQQSTRTVFFGADGVTPRSETFTMDARHMADIEKERTRQLCFNQLGKQTKDLIAAVENQPYALAMWEQSKTINNVVSLAITGKSYNPCPGSTNSSDVEIADAKMYASIYGDAFSLLKFGVGAWAGTEIADSIFGAALTGTSFNLNGDDGSINVSDSFNKEVTESITTTTEVVEIIQIKPLQVR